ncbi:unnamed protein product [Moneuplotes crassus]|uniref:Uncharacterized protein n=1 Tax=Euplotes crassus TaxID=5936 RepID=A0AAD1X7L7_EUPCR|nr:unnamed protein product [Moneuplotes crassus]
MGQGGRTQRVFGSPRDKDRIPFESICKSIIKKAENEAYQNYELVESLKNVIYEPLKDKVRDYSEKIESLDESFDDHFKKLKQSKEKLIGVDSNYNHYSKQLTEAMKKIEYKSSNRKVDFFDDKLFSSLNSKMKTVDTTAKEVESKTLELNELVAKYKEDMESKIIDLEKMEGDRIQAIVDALNQMNIFQTNCDMNNKYDSNNFNQEVDDIKTDQAVQECKTLYDPAPMIKIESYDFQQYDELITHEDIEMNEIPEQEEQKHREVIQSYVDKIEEDTLDFTKFEELMDMKINRYLFVTIVNKFSKPSLPSMKAHNNLSKLINCCLKGCDKNADSEYLKNLMIAASEIYYDEEEEEDSVIRTYITEGIRKSSIWENSAIWGKAIFKDFRDILMKFKIPKDHQEEVNKDEVLRNVFFNRLQFYVEKLAYFDMEEELLLKIVDK